MESRNSSMPSQPLGSASEKGTAGALARLLDRPLTAEELAENTRQVAQPATRERKETFGALLFQLADEVLAFAAREVARVTPVARVHAVPHRTSDVIRGICNIGGELVLCGDLARLMRLTPPTESRAGASGATAATDRRMILIGSEQSRWAFEVDAVKAVERFDPSTFENLPITVEAALVNFSEKVIPAAPRPATLLDMSRIVARLEAALR